MFNCKQNWVNKKHTDQWCLNGKLLDQSTIRFHHFHSQSKGIHREELNKNETERNVKKRIEAKASHTQKKRTDELDRMNAGKGKGKSSAGSPLKVGDSFDFVFCPLWPVFSISWPLLFYCLVGVGLSFQSTLLILPQFLTDGFFYFGVNIHHSSPPTMSYILIIALI